MFLPVWLVCSSKLLVFLALGKKKYIYIYIFFGHAMGLCGILVPWSVIELMPHEVEVMSLYLQTAREVPSILNVTDFSKPIWTFLLHASFPLSHLLWPHATLLSLPWECWVRKWGHLLYLLSFTFLDPSSQQQKGLSLSCIAWLSLHQILVLFTLSFSIKTLSYVFWAWLL